MRTITMTFLFAGLLIGSFEAFAQSDGTQNDSAPTSVPPNKKKKKRTPSHSKKPAPSTQADVPVPPAEVSSSLPPPAMEAASASPSPQRQQPLVTNATPAGTVELATQSEHHGMLMIAPKLGLFKSTTALQAAFYSGVELGIATPLLNRHFAVVFEADWVPPHYSGTIADPRLPAGSGAFALRQSEFGFLLSAVYRFDDALPGLTPYGGLGPGLYYQRASLSAFDGVNVESESKIGFQLLGGADYHLGPGALFGEVRYHFSKVDFVGTGNVNVGGFLALGVGYRLRFF